MTTALGDAKLTMINGGDFRLDGGAMHGVVPKTIWSKLISCDDLNRCTYSTNCLYLELGGKRILIETGNGDKFPQKLRDIYGIDHDRSIGEALGEIGVEPKAIDIVVMTHLHFDHSGGATRKTSSGFEPVFANATHYVQQAELDAAENAHERNRASYLPQNIGPLKEAGLLRGVDGRFEVLDGLTLVPTPGHSHGHQSVLIESGGETALFLGDVVPTALHVRLPFIMGYDLNVEQTLESKRSLWQQAEKGDWLLLFGHDRHHGARLAKNDRGQWIAGAPVDL